MCSSTRPAAYCADVQRSDRPDWERTVNAAGLREILVVVANRDQPGPHVLSVEAVSAVPLVTSTRWNTRAGNSYEIDSTGWSWTWISPDLMVDTDNDESADADVFFGQNNRLKLRLRNRGDTPANGVTVEFWYQKAAPHLSPTAWLPVANADGVVQGPVSVAALPPGSANIWAEVDWAPVDDGTGYPHWCVKARITAPDDPNTDDKIVLSNFSNVRHPLAMAKGEIFEFVSSCRRPPQACTSYM